MDWRSNKGKSGIIKLAVERGGLSYRQAEKGVNAAFAAIVAALARGEDVETGAGAFVRTDIGRVRKCCGRSTRAAAAIRTVGCRRVRYSRTIASGKLSPGPDGAFATTREAGMPGSGAGRT
jgi:nucleoid DNA-binding protein